MTAIAAIALPAFAQDTVQLDPFARATSGFSGCPERTAPLLTEAQARAEAHVRAERGTRCALEGKCEPGGAYRRDPEINERVRAALATAPQFAGTSLWVSTTRKWITVYGCVRDAQRRRALAAFVGKMEGVERVFDETTIGVTARAGR